MTPVSKRGTLTLISPRSISVVIERAWKKEVFSLPKVVVWDGTETLRGEMASALAAAGTLQVSIRSRISLRSPLVMTESTFFLINGNNFAKSLIFAKKSIFESKGLGGALDGVGLHVFGYVRILDNGFAIGNLPKFALKTRLENFPRKRMHLVYRSCTFARQFFFQDFFWQTTPLEP